MHMHRKWCSLSMLHRTCENMHEGVGFLWTDHAQWMVFLAHAHLF